MNNEYDLKYNEELEDVNSSFVDEIKKQPYWKVVFRPRKYEIRFNTVEDCERKKNDYLYRQDIHDSFYPYTGNLAFTKLNKRCIHNTVDSTYGHKAIYQFYQSGQLTHYFECPEIRDKKYKDRLTKEYKQVFNNSKKEISGFLEVKVLLKNIINIFFFASCFSEGHTYKEGLEIQISLNNIDNFYLSNFDSGNWDGVYIYDETKIDFINEYSEENILKDWKELAYQCADFFFDKFHWKQIDRSIYDKIYSDMLSQ